ncbi:MAG: F0F1 ATP synthase subunit epsilon [Chelatococcus sp.]|uniref:F0F1 ATP synthase subunit epsilon n=1 Tax=unclassified Chelatococcus TaxID=2638111 RepID=UPI001BCAAC0B|nr:MULTISPECIES: F0F1 ATP synthase subunit epsilon [unclassified Chelatococcus]CAH1656067.1 ATP synthase epsilon chain [Hyphomicrobiales bacterium]MBS7740477.1 F0F1 ATP synthase subunit epsilon [Chelatococcus sp. HY11]MBX3540574.1 F0F1 ATP synthase subunit epsilon [Chelatococcus sp.]MBX3544739.1 F0F1 ATP synthase subunit epsilon [Chelatococcus sp.]MCO5078279.1 F0F1 ATP synthase subunit epsilon [Chelatococcus sp.]
MATVPLELVAPERLLFSGDVASVIVPSVEGEMQVMPGHAPVIAVLQPGIITIDSGAGASQRLFVRGGIAEIRPDNISILADYAVPVAELTAETLQIEITTVETLVASATNDAGRLAASTRLMRLTELRMQVLR